MMVEMGASRANTHFLAKDFTSGAKELIKTGFFEYLRDPIVKIVQNNNGDFLKQSFGVLISSKRGI